MSIENVMKIGRAVLSDEKLRRELVAEIEGKKGPEAAQAAAAFAQRHGFDCTPDEVEKSYDALLKLQKGAADGELSDAELAAVAGGYGEADLQRQKNYEKSLPRSHIGK